MKSRDINSKWKTFITYVEKIDDETRKRYIKLKFIEKMHTLLIQNILPQRFSSKMNKIPSLGVLHSLKLLYRTQLSIMTRCGWIQMNNIMFVQRISLTTGVNCPTFMYLRIASNSSIKSSVLACGNRLKTFKSIHFKISWRKI